LHRIKKNLGKNAVETRSYNAYISQECWLLFESIYRGRIASINWDPIWNARAMLTGDDEFAFGMIYRSSEYIGTC